MRVTFLGTGIMGAPMARNAAAAGMEVAAWNRSAEKADPLREEGIEVAESAAAAVDGSDIVVTMLSDGEAVRAVAEADGVLEAMRGRIWAQMSTIGIEANEALAATAASEGIAYVDAPVLGTRQPAEAGELIVLAAGPPEAKERCGELFDAVGKKTFWLGDEPGPASRMKVVLNTWIVGLVEALAESLALAERVGLEPAQMLEIIEGGPMDSAYAQMKGKMMVERSFETSFPLRLAAKDARLALEAAEAEGLELPLLEGARAAMERAVEAGHGEKDLSATVSGLRQEDVRNSA
jgi:3-hydroxyisobutyrate dehydrogenase